MKRVLEMDGDDGYTMRMYLVPLNCALKMAKMVNLMLCIFYHKLKITHTHRLIRNNNGCLQGEKWISGDRVARRSFTIKHFIPPFSFCTTYLTTVFP